MGFVALLLLPAGGASANRAEALATGCGQWSIVASPNPGQWNILSGIAAISPQDVWAVGIYADTQNVYHALIEHWNGTQWSISPNPNTSGNLLSSVTALSSTDVWAVGVTSSSTLIEHWDGTSWRVIPSPGAGGALFGVSALSSTDVWAVGDIGDTGRRTLIEHWNGTRWSIVKSPNPGASGDILAGVTALSSTDVWAAGDYSTSQFSDQTLMEHWNGTQWRVIKSPLLGPYPNQFRSIAAISAHDIWAVGYYDTAPGNISLTLAEHWNGAMWSVVPSPSPTGNDLLLGVAALSTSDVWAVGNYSSGGQNLVEQWNGTSWNVIPSPFRRGTVSSLSAVSADSTADIWAAGYDISTQNFAYHTLIEHDCASGNFALTPT
jgi:hypothetical protein